MEETDLPEMFCGLFAACRVAPEVEVDLDRAADRLALDYRSSSLGEGPGNCTYLSAFRIAAMAASWVTQNAKFQRTVPLISPISSARTA